MFTRPKLWIPVLVGVVGGTGCGGSLLRAPNDPSDADSRGVAVQGTLSNRFVPATQSGSLKARLVVHSRNVSAHQRPPINLALVIDTSGSMEGQAIEDARSASLALLDLLSPGDRLSLVAFGSSTDVLLPSEPLGRRNTRHVRERILAMGAEGTTDLAGGLQAGLEQVMANFESTGINRVVLLSDGVPNDPSPIEGLAGAAGQRRIPIIALGLGLEYDEVLLGRVAQLSGGRYHYIETSNRVARVFRDEVLRLQQVVARNATLSITPGPGVNIETVIGQQTTQNGRSLQLPLGDLSDGDERELVVQLVTPTRRDGALVELIDVVVTYDDALNEGGSQESRLFLGARATDDDEELASGVNEDVERAAARLQAALATVEAIDLARNGRVEQALRELDRGVALIRDRAADEASFAADTATMEDLREALPVLGATAAAPRGAVDRADETPEVSDDEAEHRARRAHGEAMDYILSQKA